MFVRVKAENVEPGKESAPTDFSVEAQMGFEKETQTDPRIFRLAPIVRCA
jgi:hypothetical protein